MLLKTPPLGWNSWNTFGEEINETVVMQSADTLIETGLAAAGYAEMVMDMAFVKADLDKEKMN